MCFLYNLLKTCNFLSIGDAAVGEGVNRFFLSKSMTLLQFGFHINFGMLRLNMYLLCGNTDITRMFEGEPDHLTPSTAQFLLESDMFLVPGMMGAYCGVLTKKKSCCFKGLGPCISGLCPAITHVLFGGSPETTTIQIEDCPDIDTIQLLEGNAELTKQEEKAVFDLALSWDLPGVTKTNQKWLHERLLFHVISRTSRQVKQLRKGLKETMVWPFLKERADIIPTFLPRTSEAALNFHLKALLQFWTGWELLPSELTLKVVSSDFPKSATCFETLRLPATIMIMKLRY
ncbi:hypothetical protein F7725_025845 [Dissostichus mawsoni]|uniref:Uncharacterized protein n=1 Tax=Dissostichus mawsoni TaxID=36200 RepID=A0A7J5X5D6_DISMA|nr:hypothetical protein F7725_025845 [Dissostichus mawsoni]